MGPRLRRALGHDEAAIGKLRAPAEAGGSVAAAEPAESEHAVVERGENGTPLPG
uniref:hypothetical protein n=1 Tax=Microbispora cellulosiformans TaxID=2614688 RepID=UPI0017863C3C|nr:hypothetical protein [Microbispora cellulosiformans]